MSQEESAEKGIYRDIARDIIRIMRDNEGVETPISGETSLEALSIDPRDLIEEAEDTLNGIDLKGEVDLSRLRTVGDFEDIIVSFFSRERESSQIEPEPEVAASPS